MLFASLLSDLGWTAPLPLLYITTKMRSAIWWCGRMSKKGSLAATFGGSDIPFVTCMSSNLWMHNNGKRLLGHTWVQPAQKMKGNIGQNQNSKLAWQWLFLLKRAEQDRAPKWAHLTISSNSRFTLGTTSPMPVKPGALCRSIWSSYTASYWSMLSACPPGMDLRCNRLAAGEAAGGWLLPAEALISRSKWAIMSERYYYFYFYFYFYFYQQAKTCSRYSLTLSPWSCSLIKREVNFDLSLTLFYVFFFSMFMYCVNCVFD